METRHEERVMARKRWTKAARTKKAARFKVRLLNDVEGLLSDVEMFNVLVHRLQQLSRYNVVTNPWSSTGRGYSNTEVDSPSGRYILWADVIRVLVGTMELDSFVPLVEALCTQDTRQFSEEAFMEKLGLRKSSTVRCLSCLLGSRKCRQYTAGTTTTNSCACNELNVGIDHPRVFYRPGVPKGKLSVYTWFPYDLDTEKLHQLELWTEQHQLSTAVFPEDTGWYGHGTYMVAVWDPKDLR